MILGIYLLLHVFGLIYSSNLKHGLLDLEIKLPLLLFPLIFASIDLSLDKRKINIILVTFIAACFAATLFCLGYSFINFRKSGEYSEFFYDDISPLFHPSYFALYLNFAIAIILFFLIEKIKELSRIRKIVLISLLIYLSLFIILLSSKAVQITLILTYLLTVAYLVVYKKEIWKAVIIILSVALLFIVSFKLLPGAMKRINRAANVVKESDKIKGSTSEGTGERILIWKCALEIMKKHPVIGVGTGDIKDVLMAKYKEKNLTKIYNDELNAHNQFIQSQLALGILGSLILIAVFLIPGIYYFRKRIFLGFIFISIFSVNLLFESMLERQLGVGFFAFFLSFIFWIRKEIVND